MDSNFSKAERENRNSEVQKTNHSSDENILLVEDGEILSNANRTKTSDPALSLDNEITFI